MPFTNLNSDHFSPEEQEQINKGWGLIMQVLQKKTRNLSPEERKTYGSISEENKLIVQKVLDYQRNQPHLSSPDIDFKELQADWNDRTLLSGLMSKMAEGITIANNIRITHDYDAFQNARIDYNYTKYKMDTDPGAGFETKYNDLLYFFKTYSGQGAAGEAPPLEPDKQ
jgi:patatin-like phospholipase/acyl hydrolase